MVADRVADSARALPGRPSLALRRAGRQGARAAGGPDRCGWSTAGGWTRCPRCRGGPTAPDPAVRSSSRRCTCSTWPGSWSARWSRCTRWPRPRSGRAASRPATASVLGFRSGAVGTMSTSCVLRGKHRAGLEIVADGLVVGVGEDWLEVGDGTGRAGADDVRPLDRAGGRRPRASSTRCTAGPVTPTPHRPTTPRRCDSHRLACALARSAETRLRGAGAMTDRALVIESVGRRRRPAGAAAPDGPVLVRTLYSGVSAGTELTFLNGTNPALHSSFDPELGLFRPDRPGAEYPVTRLGYMEVARVEATADDGNGPAGRRAGRHDLRAPHRLPRRSAARPHRRAAPRSWTRCWASTWRTWARSAPTGCCTPRSRPAAPTSARSETACAALRVAVVGGGVIGLLTALFATYHGAAEVVVLDPTPQRRAAAEQLGLRALDPDDGDPAVILKSRWRHTAGDRGADVVFQCRGRTAVAGPGPAPASPPGDRHRPRFLHRRRRPRCELGVGVPPQRPGHPLRPDRARAPRHRARLGPGTPLRGDDLHAGVGTATRSAST